METEAAELSEAHEQLAEDVTADRRQPADSTTAALEDRAGELARQAEELSEQIAELAQELMRAAEEAAAEHATDADRAAAEAAQSDQQVANSLRNQPRRADTAARRALEQMRQASSALQEGRQQMQENWRQEVVEAMERARTEALELARRQQGLNETLNSSDAAERATTRSEQAALRRGVEQIERQLSQASESSLLVDPALVEAAADVGQALDALLGQLADGTREGRANPQLGQQASEALQELAYRLMQSSEAASLAQSGTGLQEALAQLAQLAEQQGQLNAESGGLTPGAADALLQELQRLAGQQRGIAQELNELNRSLGPRGQVLGELNQLAEETTDLADNLEQGRLDEATVNRQQRLYHRLLDAGRSLEQDELERERRAERPSAMELLRPGDLAPGLLRGPSFPHPDNDELKRYPPALRRLILEYFDRLNTGVKPGGS